MTSPALNVLAPLVVQKIVVVRCKHNEIYDQIRQLLQENGVDPDTCEFFELENEVIEPKEREQIREMEPDLAFVVHHCGNHPRMNWARVKTNCRIARTFLLAIIPLSMTDSEESGDFT